MTRLEKRYPNSKDEDITDAFIRGYQHGRTECDRPSGEWIMHIDDLFPGESTQECSVCHAEQPISIRDDNYCPSCGAKMGERKEE